MIAVVANAELVRDQIGDSSRGPQLGGVTVGLRALQEKSDKPLVLGMRQSGRSPRRGADLQGSGSPVRTRVAPAHHAAGCTIDESGDIMKRSAFVQQRQRPVPAVFQQICRAFGSHQEGPP